MAGNSEHEKHVPDLNRPEVRHESADVNVSAVGKFAVGLLLLCVVSLLLLFGLFRYFQASVGGKLPPEELNVDARKLPPEPRLEKTPILDLKAIRDAEDEELNNYGWVDTQKGVVRLPISRAIDLLAQRGLPSRPQPAAAAPNVSVPTESGLGPKMQPPGGPLAANAGPAGGPAADQGVQPTKSK